MRFLVGIAILLVTTTARGQVCVDSDGDGWGWDGTDSCVIAACVDTDGDGWGWNGFDSCRIGEIPLMTCTDVDGDGWGWNGVDTCVPGSDIPSPVRITLGSIGQELNDDAYEPGEYGTRPPIVSDDARYVLFATFADNVVANDNNDKSDVFLRNVITGVVQRISQGISGQGMNGAEANNHSNAEAVSTSGRFSVYSSYASNLVENAPGGLQLYLFDADMGTTKLISRPTDNTGIFRSVNRNAHIESGGGSVVYESGTGFVADGTEIRRYTVSNGKTETLVSVDQGSLRIQDTSSGNDFVLYFKRSGDVNDQSGQFYLYSHSSRTTVQLPIDARQGDSARLSANARYVTLVIGGSIYLLDLSDSTGTVSKLRAGFGADLSSNGRWLVFSKSGSDPDIETASGNVNLFVEDRANGSTRLLTRGLSGNGANDFMADPAFTGFNNAIVFSTRASNLITNDTNKTSDVYLVEFDAF